MTVLRTASARISNLFTVLDCSPAPQTGLRASVCEAHPWAIVCWQAVCNNSARCTWWNRVSRQNSPLCCSTKSRLPATKVHKQRQVSSPLFHKKTLRSNAGVRNHGRPPFCAYPFRILALKALWALATPTMPTPRPGYAQA